MKLGGTGDADGGGGDAPSSSSGDVGCQGRHCDIWPFDLCFCLPYGCRFLVPIPGTYRVLQDLTHCFMVAGLLSALILVVESVDWVYDNMECRPSRLPCAEEFLIVFSVLPCSFYIHRLITMYDRQLSDKEEEARKCQRSLEENYQAMTQSMETLLGKATQSQATMAERNFDDHRRDFQRFLTKTAAQFRALAKTDVESNRLLEQFRRFVLQWLRVFEECSVDPIGHPKKIVEGGELSRCQSIGEVITLVLDRLKHTEVRFITSQRDLDRKMLVKSRQDMLDRKVRFERRTLIYKKPAAAVGEIELSALPEGARSAAKLLDEEAPMQVSGMGAGGRGGEGVRDVPNSAQYKYCSWCSCGIVGCGCPVGGLSKGFPLEFSLCCIRMACLSDAHITLMFGLLNGCLMVALEAMDPPRERLVLRMVSYGFYTACLCTLLMRFEQIDTVYRLVRELAELHCENFRLQKRHATMRQFWSNMQQLMDIWVHRTMPRLNLYSEVCEQLEDAEHMANANGQEMIQLMSSANSALEDLEGRLPDLVSWRHDGGLSDSFKKHFSARIERLCQVDSLPKMVTALNYEMHDGLLSINDTAQPADVGTAPHA